MWNNVHLKLLFRLWNSGKAFVSVGAAAVCGFVASQFFFFSPGFIFQVTPFMVLCNPSCSALKDTWYFSMSKVYFCLYRCQNLSDVVFFRVKLFFGCFFPWCKSREKRQINLLCLLNYNFQQKNMSKSAHLIDNRNTVWDFQVA